MDERASGEWRSVGQGLALLAAIAAGLVFLAWKDLTQIWAAASSLADQLTLRGASSFFFGLGVACVYMIPSIIASLRKHHNAFAIFLTNLLLGWTVIGWVVALIWAFTALRDRPRP